MTDHWTDDPEVRADPHLGPFLQDLSTHADAPPDPATRTSTLERMLATAAATRPAAGPSWSRRVRRVLGLTGVKLALATGVATATTTGGLAATGSLPAPVQEFAHDVGARVGIGIPHAPGQQKKLTTGDDTGRDFAPGQRKTDESPARELAPGQQRDEDSPGRSGQAPGPHGGSHPGQGEDVQP